MTKNKTAAIVLAAGLGTRMKSTLPKVMHPIAGRPMIRHLLDTLKRVEMDRIVVVVGPDQQEIVDAVAPIPCVVQQERLGTGDAVKAAMSALKGFQGDVLVVFGDTPLITRETIFAMLESRRAAPHPAVVVLGFEPDEPGAYGRLLIDPEDGRLEAIVEAKDASAEQRDIGLCNSGLMAVDGAVLPQLLSRLSNRNAKGEYYLTDLVALAREDGFDCAWVEGEEQELIGVNTRVDLAMVETLVQDALRTRAMEGGATLLDPSTVWLCHDTKVGCDVTIGPNVFFGPGVRVGDGVVIKGFCHIEGAHIAKNAIVGPFARLRPGAILDEDSHVGNFVEIKNATVESGAKVNHLSYIGDARIGAGANVGAGTITCNYNGFTKSHTDIGAGAFIGSNSALVAPVRIGAGALVGAGSTIGEDVPDDAIAVTRVAVKTVPGGAARYRQRRQAKKDGGA